MLSSSSSRLKREECKRTKHDSVFSEWEILIGPSDWEDYSLGKDGVERYRIHNLPTGSCPGLYELGVAAIPTNEGHRSRKYASDIIIVVYLGQADNVRTRLQHYGCMGSHLAGLFTERFSRGYSIMFRWAPMTNKKEAENMESELLRAFDYAWNRRGNGACRCEDILSKIDTSVPFDELGPSNGRISFLPPQVFKYVKSQPRLVQGDDSIYMGHDICRVAVGNGFVCTNRPVDGQKRCVEHKGERISGTSSVTTREMKAAEGNSSACGVTLEDGSCCMELPDHERKRCELHKGRRTTETILKAPEIRLPDRMGTAVWKPQRQLVQGTSYREGWVTRGTYNLEDDCNNCGVVTGNGYICRRKPFSGRERCEEHKGQRINSTSFTTGREVSAQRVNSSMCGVHLGNGSICMKSPVPPRKRCELHKGRRVT